MGSGNWPLIFFIFFIMKEDKKVSGHEITAQFFPKWEMKERTYRLKKNMNPISYRLKSKNIKVWDEKNKKYHTTRYTTNYDSIFVEEQGDDPILERLEFTDGTLQTSREDVVKQQFLQLHSSNGKTFELLDFEQEAVDELDYIKIRKVGIRSCFRRRYR